MALRVLIADDHGLLRAGLRSLLRAEKDVEVVGEAADGNQAVDMTVTLCPDVLLADISMPGPNGIEVARILKKKQPSTRVLMLTMHEDNELMREAFKAGAAGYLIKRAAEADLVNAIRVVARGEMYIHHDMLRFATPSPCTEPVKRSYPTLDATETNVLRLLAHGYTTAQIAHELTLTVPAVETVHRTLVTKLGVSGRIRLLQTAAAMGLLDEAPRN